MTVRAGTLEDMDTFVEWARAFHKMSYLKQYRFSPQGTRNWLSMMIQQSDCLVLRNDHGFIGASITDYPFCDVRIAKEIFWYAEKDGLPLLQGFGEWAVEKEADIQLISSLRGDDRLDAVFERLMRRSGYEVIEHSYLKRNG